MSGESQYIADTLLLEETFRVLSELNQSRMEKYAWDLASILPSIGSFIHSNSGEQFRNEPNSLLRTVEDFLLPAVATGIHPLLGVLVAVAVHFGFDLTSVYERIKKAILPDLKAGKPVSAETINAAAASAIPAATEGSAPEQAQETAEADDLLHDLRAMRDANLLTKEAIGRGMGGQKAWDTEGNWFNPLKGLLSLFGRRKGNILVGLLVWFLKTVLLSAGMLGVASAVLPKKNPITGQEPNSPAPASTSNVGGGIFTSSNTPPSTGAGAYQYKKAPGDMWVEVLNGRQPYEMVMNWALLSYPTLNQYKSIIMNTPSFWNAVRSISEDWSPGQTEMTIPDPYKSRDDVLKLFVDDVFKAVTEGRK